MSKKISHFGARSVTRYGRDFWDYLGPGRLKLKSRTRFTLDRGKRSETAIVY